jgi:hypothetical protein
MVSLSAPLCAAPARRRLGCYHACSGGFSSIGPAGRAVSVDDAPSAAPPGPWVVRWACLRLKHRRPHGGAGGHPPLPRRLSAARRSPRGLAAGACVVAAPPAGRQDSAASATSPPGPRRSPQMLTLTGQRPPRPRRSAAQHPQRRQRRHRLGRQRPPRPPSGPDLPRPDPLARPGRGCRRAPRQAPGGRILRPL